MPCTLGLSTGGRTWTPGDGTHFFSLCPRWSIESSNGWCQNIGDQAGHFVVYLASATLLASRVGGSTQQWCMRTVKLECVVNSCLHAIWWIGDDCNGSKSEQEQRKSNTKPWRQNNLNYGNIIAAIMFHAQSKQFFRLSTVQTENWSCVCWNPQSQ